jgi:uncharacterized damage-inducible protein DinB
MAWTDLLKAEMNATYRAADGLMALCDDSMLGWKPSTGSNWMTVGQLLKHVTDACGACCKGFVTGDWGMPADASPDEMLPTAEKMGAVSSVAEARKLLAADKRTALAMVKKVGERGLATKKAVAPWDPKHPAPLGVHFLHMVQHLATHKAQLFYYLKLMGKPVHTGNLWGM